MSRVTINLVIHDFSPPATLGHCPIIEAQAYDGPRALAIPTDLLIYLIVEV